MTLRLFFDHRGAQSRTLTFFRNRLLTGQHLANSGGGGAVKKTPCIIATPFDTVPDQDPHIACIVINFYLQHCKATQPRTFTHSIHATSDDNVRICAHVLYSHMSSICSGTFTLHTSYLQNISNRRSKCP